MNKYKSDQNGSGVLEIILFATIIFLLGVVGWTVFNKQNTPDNLSSNNEQSNQIKEDLNNTDRTESGDENDNKIFDVSITLVSVEDIEKLPDYTPKSFRTFMLKILEDNKYIFNPDEDVETITEYDINKISSVNISGGQSPVDKNGVGYPGGAPRLYVLNPQEEWDIETLNGPNCKSKNGGLVYVEFAEYCHRGSNGSDWGKNPNGSVRAVNN